MDIGFYILEILLLQGEMRSSQAWNLHRQNVKEGRKGGKKEGKEITEEQTILLQFSFNKIQTIIKSK